MFYRLVVPLHTAFKWISEFSIQILHHRQMFDRLAPHVVYDKCKKMTFIYRTLKTGSSDIITSNEVHLEVNR